MELDPVEQRVLGCLLEKQVTVPATYPLSVNALRTACNQSSSRDPVMELAERDVVGAARSLREQGLARSTWADTGRRTVKYEHTMDDVLPLDGAQRALVTVLLLRGPQAPGELRARTERLHRFADRDAVEACLRGLAEREPPVVRQLPRRPGQQDHRWVHLLGPVPQAAESEAGHDAAAVVPEADAEAPLADGAQVRDARVRQAYTAIAGDYADRFADVLDVLPFERWLLDRVVQLAAGRPVMDAGCGPGMITAYLVEAGADAQGLDATPAMVEQARRRHPQLRFEVGDLTRLMRPATATGWGAVLGWYSLIHLASSEFAPAVASLARPLAPGGVLALAVHAGRTAWRQTSWFDHDVEVDFVKREPDEVVAAMTAAGLVDLEWYRRGPLTRLDEVTERLFVLGHRPG